MIDGLVFVVVCSPWLSFCAHTHIYTHTYKQQGGGASHHHSHHHGHPPSSSASTLPANVLAQGLANVNLQQSLNTATAAAGKGMKSVADELVRKAWQR